MEKYLKISLLISIGVVLIVVLTKQEQTQNPDAAFKLASLDSGTSNPHDSLVDDYRILLEELSSFCPNETRDQIANYIYIAQGELEKQNIQKSLSEIGSDIKKSIPSEVAGVVQCAEVSAAYVTLSTE